MEFESTYKTSGNWDKGYGPKNHLVHKSVNGNLCGCKDAEGMGGFIDISDDGIYTVDVVSGEKMSEISVKEFVQWYCRKCIKKALQIIKNKEKK